MLHKLIFLSALFCLIADPITAVRPHPGLLLRRGQKISKLTGDSLIQAACQGFGDNETECVSTLQSASPDQKADANALALFTLKFVENRAEYITTGIRQISAVPDVTPLLDSALSDCMDQYNSIDDLIETAEIAVEAKNYADAQEFIHSAVSSIGMCDSGLKSSTKEEKAENLTGQSEDMEKYLKMYNLFHRNLLLAALKIITMD